MVSRCPSHAYYVASKELTHFSLWKKCLVSYLLLIRDLSGNKDLNFIIPHNKTNFQLLCNILKPLRIIIIIIIMIITSVFRLIYI